MTTREMVELVIAACGRVRGRVVLQKLMYFAALATNVDLGYRAHYYGPFSGTVETAVNNAVESGEVDETVERFSSWGTGPDLHGYSYELTDEGRERVAQVRAEHPGQAARVEAAVEAIRAVVPRLNQRTLSSAAKTHRIIAEQGGARLADIPPLARQLGWRLTNNQVENTVQILQDLDLISVTRTE